MFPPVMDPEGVAHGSALPALLCQLFYSYVEALVKCVRSKNKW
jgi:hypothetical protein